MKYETSVVYLEQIPKIIIDSGFDWATFFSFSVTALVVALGTFYNAYVFKGTVKGQEDIAKNNFNFLRDQSKSEFLAKSRLQWVETLRDEVSLFLSFGARVQAVAQFIIKTDWMIAGSQEEYNRHQEMYRLHYSEFTSALSTGRMHFSKVELMLNLNDKDEEALISAMSTYIQAASKYEAINDLAKDVTIAARTILRRELDRANAM